MGPLGRGVLSPETGSKKGHTHIHVLMPESPTSGWGLGMTVVGPGEALGRKLRQTQATWKALGYKVRAQAQNLRAELLSWNLDFMLEHNQQQVPLGCEI